VVNEAFRKWAEKQKNLRNYAGTQIVRMLNSNTSVRVNCLNGDGVAELRSIVLDTAMKTRGYHEPLPKSWVDLREKIRQVAEARKFMSWPEYKNMACKECSIDENMLLIVTFFFKKLLSCAT